MSFRGLREWRRGESNRPVEDSGGRNSKLDGYLLRRRLPPATVVYPQSVPKGQPGNVLRAHSGGVIASYPYICEGPDLDSGRALESHSLQVGGSTPLGSTSRLLGSPSSYEPAARQSPVSLR